ncbi:copper resistance system multicopper oxidase [Paeniroseomonas aquatica]|uniref:Copper resistance system multicopper oxidase n=2 Tax=Paeniroseomonas aquatica TaxID=373043 RepID=A0ABT8A2E5_9PROT|nr:copper resistance system multicopper oxidase [Paeniroseomonas aquatica]MDN3563885.1 copper resistance system multicopper oxidase [Paeniroseomonas aquatica]
MVRRDLLRVAGATGLLMGLTGSAPTYAQTPAAGAPGLASIGGSPIDLVIEKVAFAVDGRIGSAVAMNRTVPGPVIRLREGEDAVLRVTNRLEETSSIHWHGLILPPGMDGVPGVSFAGIRPGETFVYRFPVRQSGTYWCHSHSGGQELLGLYAPLIIDPAGPEPFRYTRDHVVMLSDWSFEPPEQLLAHMKSLPSYYNYQQRTVSEFFRDARRDGLGAAVSNRLDWGRMLMDPTDISDLTGDTYRFLMNGLAVADNWTGLFRPGEAVRLRFIDAGAMTVFDVRIPDLKMTVVQVHGQNVKPVEVDELRIAPGETYDVIVRPGNRAYTVFAEASDRSGHARGTLAPRPGMSAAVPPRRPRPTRTMADMGMDMSGMAMGGGAMGADAMAGAPPAAAGHGGMAMPAGNAMPMPGAIPGPGLPGGPPVAHGPDTHGVGSSSVAMVERSRLDEPGLGLGGDGWRVLTYADLRSVAPQPDQREPGRAVELHLTGNMERYMWSFDGKKYSEAPDAVRFRYGERIRMVLVNDTMMEHPIHLHGMWMELENGGGPNQPRLHTVLVKPSERLTVAITADEPGRWAMHCHLLLHMEMGMFRVVEVA